MTHRRPRCYKLMLASMGLVPACSRMKTSIFCKQSPNRSSERICCYRAQVSCCSLGYGKVSPFSVWQSLPAWNWPKTLGDHLIKKLESGYTEIAKDAHQNIPIHFQCALSARLKEPASRLFDQRRRTSKFYQSAQAECIPNHKPT